MMLAALVAAAVPQALKALESKEPETLGAALHDAAVPYLVNPRHRTLLARVLLATAERLQPGVSTRDGAP